MKSHTERCLNTEGFKYNAGFKITDFRKIMI